MLLFNEKPEKGRVEIENEVFVLEEKGKEKMEIHLSEIHAAAFVYNKLILWLVIGGTVAPLAGVGFIKSILNPWVALAFIVGGILTFYYGWQGRSMLQITYGIHKKIVVGVDDNARKWHAFIAALRELRALY